MSGRMVSVSASSLEVMGHTEEAPAGLHYTQGPTTVPVTRLSVRASPLLSPLPHSLHWALNGQQSLLVTSRSSSMFPV